MRAIEVPEHGAPAVLSVAERPEPDPTEGEVRVDVTAAGVNFADIEKRRGRYPSAPEPPYVPGVEVAGRITAAEETARFEEGDRVMALPRRGGYAESVVVDARSVFRAPDGVDLRSAAAIPVQWTTAHNALFEWGDLGADERVLIHAAAGGVGSAAVQLAATTGAIVLGTASTDEKRAFVRDLGADHAIDYTERDIAAAVEDATGGVDLVLDGVGGEAFEASLDALAPGGRIVAYGLASGEVPRVSTPRLLFGNHTVHGYHLRRALDHDRGRVVSAVDRTRELLDDGAVDVQIDRTLSLSEAAEAHRHIEDRNTRGKVVLET